MPSVSGKAGKLDHSCPAGGNVKWQGYNGKQLDSFFKTKDATTI